MAGAMSKAGFPVHKPRRAFRAWLIHELTEQGAQFSAKPSYVEIQLALATRGFVAVRLGGRAPAGDLAFRGPDGSEPPARKRRRA